MAKNVQDYLLETLKNECDAFAASLSKYTQQKTIERDYARHDLTTEQMAAGNAAAEHFKEAKRDEESIESTIAQLTPGSLTKTQQAKFDKLQAGFNAIKDKRDQFKPPDPDKFGYAVIVALAKIAVAWRAFVNWVRKFGESSDAPKTTLETDKLIEPTVVADRVAAHSISKTAPSASVAAPVQGVASSLKVALAAYTQAMQAEAQASSQAESTVPARDTLMRQESSEVLGQLTTAMSDAKEDAAEQRPVITALQRLEGACERLGELKQYGEDDNVDVDDLSANLVEAQKAFEAYAEIAGPDRDVQGYFNAHQAMGLMKMPADDAIDPIENFNIIATVDVLVHCDAKRLEGLKESLDSRRAKPGLDTTEAGQLVVALANVEGAQEIQAAQKNAATSGQDTSQSRPVP